MSTERTVFSQIFDFIPKHQFRTKDVIDFIIRHKENEDLDERLKEVEKLLVEKKL